MKLETSHDCLTAGTEWVYKHYWQWQNPSLFTEWNLFQSVSDSTQILFIPWHQTHFSSVTERGMRRLCCWLHPLPLLWVLSWFPAFSPLPPSVPVFPLARPSSPKLKQSLPQSTNKEANYSLYHGHVLKINTHTSWDDWSHLSLICKTNDLEGNVFSLSLPEVWASVSYRNVCSSQCSQN